MGQFQSAHAPAGTTKVDIQLIEQLLDAENRRALFPEYEGDHGQGRLR
jgi:hypothetical protein